jgi:GH24 family phage-related lysozyme (muramidase)
LKLVANKNTWAKRDTQQAALLPPEQKFEVSNGESLEVAWVKKEPGHSLVSLVSPIKGFYNWYIWGADFESAALPHPPAAGVSAEGIQLISSFEGYEERLPDGRVKAYWDGLGEVWTIGYGSTRFYQDDGVVRAVRSSDIITHAQAIDFKAKDLKKFVDLVQSILGKNIPQGELDALVSLAYNTGSEPLLKSVGKYYAARKKALAANAFLLYNKSGSPLRTVYGLSRRRAAERALFLGEDWSRFVGSSAADAVVQVYGSRQSAGLPA